MDSIDIISTNERTIIDFSNWGINGLVVIGHYKYFQVRPKLPRHHHPNLIEVVYCAKGEQMYEVNEQTYLLKGGDIFITLPDEFHSTAGYPEDKGELYWIMIDLSNEKLLNYEKQEAKAIKHSVLHIPNRHFSGSNSIKQILEKIVAFHKYESLNLIQKITVKHLIEGFLLELTELGYKETATINDETIIAIKLFIDKNIKNDFSISQLASHVHLSESRFKAWFKEQTGIPPLEYVQRKKIQLAKELILRGQDSIYDVSFELGFSSSQYFTKVFKKFTGLNPGEIKK